MAGMHSLTLESLDQIAAAVAVDLAIVEIPRHEAERLVRLPEAMGYVFRASRRPGGRVEVEAVRGPGVRDPALEGQGARKDYRSWSSEMPGWNRNLAGHVTHFMWGFVRCTGRELHGVIESVNDGSTTAQSRNVVRSAGTQRAVLSLNQP